LANRHAAGQRLLVDTVAVTLLGGVPHPEMKGDLETMLVLASETRSPGRWCVGAM